MSFEIILAGNHRYYAGMDLPWYVSRSMVSDALAKQGLTNIVWYDRETPLPSNVKPKELCKNYEDNWVEWVTGIYTGPDGTGELPEKPAWIMYAKLSTADKLPPAPTPTPGDSSTGGSTTTLLGALAVVAGLAALKKLMR